MSSRSHPPIGVLGQEASLGVCARAVWCGKLSWHRNGADTRRGVLSLDWISRGSPMREFVLTDFAEVCEPSHDIGRTLRSFLRFRVYEIRRRLGSEATEADGLLLEGRLVGAAGLSKGLIAALEADRAT